MFLLFVRGQAWKLDSVCGMLRVHRAAKWHLLSVPQHSSCCFPMFRWLFLAADAQWADDLRQLLTAVSGPLSWAMTASSVISIEELWFGLFSSTCVWIFLYICILYVYLHWNSYANSVPSVQFCEILQGVVIGMTFDCPKEVRNIHRPGDFVYSFLQVVNEGVE